MYLYVILVLRKSGFRLSSLLVYVTIYWKQIAVALFNATLCLYVCVAQCLFVKIELTKLETCSSVFRILVKISIRKLSSQYWFPHSLRLFPLFIACISCIITFLKEKSSNTTFLIITYRNCRFSISLGIWIVILTLLKNTFVLYSLL